MYIHTWCFADCFPRQSLSLGVLADVVAPKPARLVWRLRVRSSLVVLLLCSVPLPLSDCRLRLAEALGGDALRDEVLSRLLT
jgi:hypothetical protein